MQKLRLGRELSSGTGQSAELVLSTAGCAAQVDIRVRTADPLKPERVRNDSHLGRGVVGERQQRLSGSGSLTLLLGEC